VPRSSARSRWSKYPSYINILYGVARIPGGWRARHLAGWARRHAVGRQRNRRDPERAVEDTNVAVRSRSRRARCTAPTRHCRLRLGWRSQRLTHQMCEPAPATGLRCCAYENASMLWWLRSSIHRVRKIAPHANDQASKEKAWYAIASWLHRTSRNPRSLWPTLDLLMLFALSRAPAWCGCEIPLPAQPNVALCDANALGNRGRSQRRFYVCI